MLIGSHDSRVKCHNDSLISSQIAKQKKQIMVGLRLFLGKFERIANSRSELASELSYTA